MEQEQEFNIDLGRWFGALRRWYRLIILTTVLVGGTALLVGFLTPPSYEAEATVAIVKSANTVNFDPKFTTTSDVTVDQVARRKSLTTLAKSPDLANAVIAKVGAQLFQTPPDPNALAAGIGVVNDGDLIRIKATGKSPEMAAILANTWAREYETNINSLYGENALSSSDLNARVELAKKDYDAKEVSLVAYLAANPIDKLSRQITETQKILTSVINQQTDARIQKLSDSYVIANKLDRLMADALALRARLASGTSNAVRGDDLASILLEASAFSTWSSLPVNLQIPIDQFSVNATASDQLKSLDALIGTFKTRRNSVQSDIDAQSKELLANPNYSTAVGNLDQLMQQVTQLQSQVEQENAKKQELTRARDLAWDSYKTLGNKVAEVGVAAPGSLVRLATPAVLPQLPSAPKKTTNTLIGLAIGFLLGAAIALGFEFMNNTIHTEAQINQRLGLSVIAEIPELPLSSQPKVEMDDNGNQLQPVSANLAVLDPRAPATEAFRVLRHNLLGRDSKWKVIAIVSATPAEGKSTIAANLAAITARAGKQVILVDADFRRPAQHYFFGVKNATGLSNILNGAVEDWEMHAQETLVDGLRLVTSGPLPSDPAMVLESPELKHWFDLLRQAADTVIVDTPAALGLADALVVANAAEASVLVVGVDSVSERDAARAKELLATAGALFAGVVLNRVDLVPGAMTYAYYSAGPDQSPSLDQNHAAVRSRGAVFTDLRDRVMSLIVPRKR